MFSFRKIKIPEGWLEIILHLGESYEKITHNFSLRVFPFPCGSVLSSLIWLQRPRLSGDRTRHIHAWMMTARRLLSNGLCFCSRPDVLFLPGNSSHCRTLLYDTLWMGCRSSLQISQEQSWINGTAGNLRGEGAFFAFLIHAVSASSDPGCHEWFFLVTGEKKERLCKPNSVESGDSVSYRLKGGDQE